MSQPLLTESSEKTKQRIERRGPRPDSARSFQGGSNPILQLQRTLGNQRVAQLIKAKRLTPEGRIIGLQPKLTVGAADDQFEQEADRVARQVISTPDSVAMASFQQTSSVEGESTQTQTLQNKPLPLAGSITPFVQRQMSREEAIEEEKDREEDKEELLQAKFLNKSVALPLQRLTAAEEVEAEPIQAKLLIQRSISPEENKDQKPKTMSSGPLAASITSFVQRQTENNEELEENEPPVQAKFLSRANSGFLQQQAVTKEEEPETIQAKSAASLSNSFEAGDDVESRLSQSKGGGSQLPELVRAYMEPRFGVDFSHVNVHTGSNAAQMNQAIGAQAFTHGSDIYFGAGSSPMNLELTAHELTHVVQQTGDVPLQAKRLNESSLANADPFPQRTGYGADSGEENRSDSSFSASGAGRHIRIPAGGGTALPREQRDPFEQVLGQSLEHVRMHTGSAVDEAAHHLQADAFTVGSDVYIPSRHAAPGHPDADRVLAHELTHVVQYDEGRIPAGGTGQNPVSQPSDALEQEAYAQEGSVADAVTRLRHYQRDRGRGEALSVRSKTSDAEANGSAAGPAVVDRPSNSAGAETLIARRVDEQGAEGPPVPAVDSTTDSEVRTGPADEQLLQKPPLPPSPLGADETPPAPEAPVALAVPSPKIPRAAAKAPSHGADEIVPTASGAATRAVLSPTEEKPKWMPLPDDLAIRGLAPISAREAPELTTPEPVPSADVGRPDTADADVQADNLTQDAQTLAQSIGQAGEAALTALATEVARLTELAHGEATQARTGLAVAYSAQQVSVQAEAQASLAAIEQTRQQQQQMVMNIATAERERLHTAFQTERQSAVDFVEGLKPAIIAIGEEQAQRATVESEARASAILTEAQAAPTRGDPPAVEAQQKAAQQIAERAAMQCQQTGTDLADRVRQEAANYAASDYGAGLQDYLAQLDQQLIDSEAALDEFMSQAHAQIDAVAAQAAGTVQELSDQSAAALDTELATAENKIDAWEAQVPATLQAAADQLQETFSSQLAPFAEALTTYGVTSAAQVRSLSGAATEDIDASAAQARQDLHAGYDMVMGGMSDWQGNATQELSAAFEGVREQLGALVSDERAAVDDVGGKLIHGLQQITQSAATDMEAAASSFQTHLTGGVDDAIQQMTSAGEEMRAKMQENRQAVIAALVRVVDDALTGEDNLLADARAEMATTLPEIADKYQELQAEAEQRNNADTEVPVTRIHRGIWSSITGWWSEFTDSVKHWFADTFGEFWGGLLYAILETLVIVVVGALAIWALATGIGALIVALGFAAVATAKIALIVTAVLLVLLIIPMMIYNRMQEYRQDNPGKEIGVWTGIGLGLLGIADVTGIPFIIEGAVGQRATGGELHGWDRGFRLGQGIVMFGTVIFGAYRFLKGRGSRPGARNRSPTEIGEAIGEEARLVPSGKRARIAQRVSEAGLSQDDAATATSTASKIFGDVGATVTLPDGSKVVPSVQAAPPPGAPGQPIFVVRPNGSVFPARATLTARMEPAPHVEITDIVPD